MSYNIFLGGLDESHFCILNSLFLEVRDKEILKELSTEYRDRLKARRISMVGNQAGSGLDDLRVELQYFFGWT